MFCALLGKEKEDIAEIVSKVSLADKKQPAKAEESDDEDIPDIDDADFDNNVVEEEDPVSGPPSLSLSLCACTSLTLCLLTWTGHT